MVGLRTHRVRALVAVAAIAVAVGAVTGRAATRHDPWTVTSPDGALSARVGDHGGALSISVRRHGRQVLATTLGPGSLHAAHARRDTIDESYATPAGKRRKHELSARRLTITFPGGRRLEVLAAGDGVAFRQAGAGGRPTAWRAPPGTRAWLQSYRRDYEGHYNPIALRDAQAGDYGFPALLDTGAGTWALLTESGLTREPAARLTVAKDHPGALAVTLPQGDSAQAMSPWRVAIVGDLGTIVGSDLAKSLGRPSRIRNTSWIHPGRVA